MQALLPRGTRGTALIPILALALVLGLPGAPARADLVVLTNGREIRGRVLREGPQEVVLEVPYGHMAIPRRQIEEIRKESRSTYLVKSGERLLAARDYDTALTFLREAAAQNPDSRACRDALLDGLCHAARATFERHQYLRAREHVAEASALAPDDPRIESVRADLEQIDGERAAAEQAAAEAVAAGDPRGALDRFRWLVENFPEERERWRAELARSALAAAHQALGAERAVEAEGLYAEALAHEPDLIAYAREPIAYLAVRRSVPLLEAGDFEGAVRRLAPARELLPDHPAVLYHLGLALEGSGRPAAAAEMYARVAGEERMLDGVRHLSELRLAAEACLAPPTNRTDDSGTAATRTPAKGTATATASLETRHFVIRHQDAELAAEAGRLLEHHLDRLQRSWFRPGQEPTLPGRIRIALHAGRESFESAASPPPWSDGITRQERRYGLLTHQEIHCDAHSPQLLTSVLPHELAHVLLPHRLGNRLALPRWLDEGIASAEEPTFKQRHYTRRAREALIDGTLFPLAELLASREYPAVRGRVEIFYAQSNTVVRFIQERLGMSAAMELFRRLASRAPAEALDGQHPFGTVGELERAWLRWLAEQPGR